MRRPPSRFRSKSSSGLGSPGRRGRRGLRCGVWFAGRRLRLPRVRVRWVSTASWNSSLSERSRPLPGRWRLPSPWLQRLWYYGSGRHPLRQPAEALRERCYVRSVMDAQSPQKETVRSLIDPCWVRSQRKGGGGPRGVLPWPTYGKARLPTVLPSAQRKTTVYVVWASRPPVRVRRKRSPSFRLFSPPRSVKARL